jgi:hypothetical protein
MSSTHEAGTHKTPMHDYFEAVKQVRREHLAEGKHTVRIVAGVVALLLVGAVVIVAVRGGGGSDVPPASVATPAAPVLTPTDAALALYVAWQRGDTAAVEQVASTGGASDMSAIDPTSAAGLAFSGCAAAEGNVSTCVWKRSDATLNMDVSTAGGSPQVQRAQLTRQ